MARVFTGLTAARVRANLEEARERIAAAAARAGRDPGDVEILAAGKYVPAAELDALADAGVTLIGENRAQDLAAKVESHGDRFTWDFIGALQSRKVKVVAPHVRLIHSVASESALRELGRLAAGPSPPAVEVLLQVDVAGEESKAGIAPAELPGYLEACPVPVAGLMTMPPLAERPEDNRRWFAALRELAERHGLRHLSMGTTQDFPVAVEEGATIVRLGTTLFS